MHHSLIEGNSKYIVPYFDLFGRFTLQIIDLNLHSTYPPPAFSMSNSPFLAPGTAPLISSKWRAKSTFSTLRLRCVTRLSPMCPAMRNPLNTRPGDVVAPVEPGARWRSDCPWVLGPPAK